MKKTTVLENKLKNKISKTKLVDVEIEVEAFSDESPKYKCIALRFSDGFVLDIRSTQYSYELDCLAINDEYVAEYDETTKIELRKEEIKRKQREIEREKEQLQKELDELE